MNITAGMSGLKAAADATKWLREALKAGQVKVEDIAPKIGEIYDYIIDSKAALSEAHDENLELKRKLQALDDHKALDAELAHDGYVFWRTHDENKTGPFCPFCWSQDNKLVPLKHVPGNFTSSNELCKRYDCSDHESFLVPTGEKYTPPTQTRRNAGRNSWMG